MGNRKRKKYPKHKMISESFQAAGTGRKLIGLSNIFLYAGKDRFDNFLKVVKSQM